MPLYRGDAHQSFTACTCSSKSASSADPALDASGSSWKASPGRTADTGGSTVGSDELDMRYGVVESERKCRVALLDTRTDRHWRMTLRGNVRSIAIVCSRRKRHQPEEPGFVCDQDGYLSTAKAGGNRKSILMTTSEGRRFAMFATRAYKMSCNQNPFPCADQGPEFSPPCRLEAVISTVTRQCFSIAPCEPRITSVSNRVGALPLGTVP